MSEQMLCGPWRAPSSWPPDFHFQELFSHSRSQNGAEPRLTFHVYVAWARNSCLLLEACGMLGVFVTEHDLA